MRFPTHNLHRWYDRQREPYRLLLVVVFIGAPIGLANALVDSLGGILGLLSVALLILLDRVNYLHTPKAGRDAQ